MEEKVKKPFYKRWYVWLIALIFIYAIATSGDENDTTKQPVENEPEVEVNDEEPVEEKNRSQSLFQNKSRNVKLKNQ